MSADFSQGRVWKRIVAQSVPLMMAQLVQLLYNVVDRIYLGHMPGAGSAALTGVGLTFPVVTLIAAFTGLFATGGTPLFSIARDGTTNGYQIVELIGSETKSRRAGEKGIIIFGNNYAKHLAQNLIQRKWKASQSLKYMGEVFEDVLREVASKTPTVGDKYDTLIQQPSYSAATAQQHLNMTIDQDIKVLIKFRQDLTEKLVQQSIEIEMAGKIINEGEVGRVVSIDGNMLFVQLNDKTQALDENWKQKAAPGQNVLMFTESGNVKLGDKVVIEDEKLCLKKDKSPLDCNIILCSL